MIQNDLTQSLKVCFCLSNIKILMDLYFMPKDVKNSYKELVEAFPNQKDLCSRTKNITYDEDSLKVLRTKTLVFYGHVRKAISNSEQKIHFNKTLTELFAQIDVLSEMI